VTSILVTIAWKQKLRETSQPRLVGVMSGRGIYQKGLGDVLIKEQLLPLGQDNQ
jgi:hypothetical protein